MIAEAAMTSVNFEPGPTVMRFEPPVPSLQFKVINYSINSYIEKKASATTYFPLRTSMMGLRMVALSVSGSPKQITSICTFSFFNFFDNLTSCKNK